MRESTKEAINFLKSECTAPKRELISILSRMECINTAQAKKLERVLIALEKWQQSPAV